MSWEDETPYEAICPTRTCFSFPKATIEAAERQAASANRGSFCPNSDHHVIDLRTGEPV